MRYDDLQTYILERLTKELSPGLVYHDVTHTRNVISASEEIARSEGVSGEDLVLLKTAALFHDTGFIETVEGHEAASCALAEKILPGYGYAQIQVNKICEAIAATKLPQSPTSKLGEILADADLYYLGKGGYEGTANNLLREMRSQGQQISENDWIIKQVTFISGHRYFTASAQKQLESKKQKTLASLKNKSGHVSSSHHATSFGERLMDLVFVVVGILIAGVALKGFLVPNHFFDGGITGISLLVHEVYGFNLGLVILVLNLPLIAVSYYSVGKRFAFRTLASVILLGVCLLLLPSFALTADKLLICIFGGVFLGIGIGLVMRAGAALDSIEVLALYTLRRTSFTITEIILGINIIIFSIAAFRFGIETALYSILTYFAAARSIDYVVDGFQAFTGVTIVSGKSEEIKYELVNKLGRAITVYKGERGYLPGKYDISSDCDIIFTIITRLEMRKLKNLVYEVDPNAFVFANTIREASGGIIKRRQSH